MQKEFLSSNDMDIDQLDEMLEKVENGEMVEINGAFSDDCYLEVIHDELDPCGARLKTKSRVERVKRTIELSRGRKNRQYRDFSS